MHGSYIFGTSAGLPTKDRNTQAIALNLEPYSNSIWLFDVGEGTQHQILHHSIKLGKVDHIFIRICMATTFLDYLDY